MATASLLCNIFNDVYQKKDNTEYCMICFRTLEERRLVEGTNVMKFKYFRQSNRLRSKDNTRYEKSLSENCLVCYICDRQAAAAVKFCIALNLSNKLHYMYSKMRLNDSYRKDMFTLLAGKGVTGATQHDKEATESEAVLNQIRNTNNLLQTETLTLGNDIRKEDPPHTARGKMRDLFSFETRPVTEEDPLAELTELTSQPDLMTKTILLEDDDVSNDEPHPVAIIHNAINDRQTDTDQQTERQTPSILTPQQNLQNLIQNQTGMILQPVILNINENNQNFALKGATITQNNQNFALKGATITQNNQNFAINNGTLTSLNGQNFVINPISGNISMPILAQYLNKDQLIPINNLNVNNQFILPVNQNNMLVPQNQNNTVLLSQNQNNTVLLSQNLNNSMAMAQNINTPTNQNSTKSQTESDKMAHLAALKRSIDKKFQGDGNNAPINSRKGQETGNMLHLAGVKRAIDMKCQSESVNSPTPVKSGKIDWEDQIPMDVISCVSNTDPSVQPRGPPHPLPPRYVPPYQDAVDSFVITDVKSISEKQHDDVVDLC